MGTQIVQHPVPLLLKKVHQEKIHGELIVKSEGAHKTLYFYEGNLIFADTSQVEERLGEILFKIGKIDRIQFGNLKKLIKSEKVKLGKLLVRQDIVSHRDVFFALLYQVRTIAASTFTMLSGEWNFVPQIPRVPADSRFKIEIPSIISENIDKLANIEYFKNTFLNRTLKAKAIPRDGGKLLSTYDAGLLKELKAAGEGTGEQLFSKFSMPEDTFWRKLALFYLLDMLAMEDAEAAKPISKNAEEVLLLYERLTAGAIDYYQLFKIKNTADAAEIKNAYFSYAKKYHPDRISGDSTSDLPEKANYVFAEINKAYETLSDHGKKGEYDSSGYKDNSSEAVLREHLLEKAKILYHKAKMLYKTRKYWDAASLMDEAVGLDGSKSSYFLLLGLCQLNLPALKRMAEKNLLKVLDMERWSVEATYSLGILYMSENQAHRAETYFNKALSFNPEHKQSLKKLEELKGSQKKKSGFSLFGRKKK
ncbi:MAG: DnaJ domain-containing protein [bacterium]|nr:DnaJ domain-containing protein [bacterium]